MSAAFHARRLFKPSSPDSAVMVRVGAAAPAKREVLVQSSPDSSVMVAVPAVGRNFADYSVLDPYGRHGAPQAPALSDLYARSVARQFPSYGYAGSDLPPDGAFGITADGRVWKNSENFWGQKYPMWSPSDSYTKEGEGDLSELKEANVGYRSAFADAVAAARARAGSSAGAPSIATAVPAGTYTDGTWTYVVATDGSMVAKGPRLPAEGKRFEAGSDAMKNLAADKASGKVKPGAAPASSGSAPVRDVQTVSDTSKAALGETPFYKKPWFIYSAVGVGVLGIAGVIMFSGSGKAAKPKAA